MTLRNMPIISDEDHKKGAHRIVFINPKTEAALPTGTGCEMLFTLGRPVTYFFLCSITEERFSLPDIV